MDNDNNTLSYRVGYALVWLLLAGVVFCAGAGVFIVAVTMLGMP